VLSSRLPLVSITLGSGTVMARSADANWHTIALTVAAAALMLWPRLNPLAILFAGGVLGGFGLL
jgi:hypothetical protein